MDTQDADAELKAKFTPLAEQLATEESKIVDELNSVQGKAMELGGDYFPDQEKVQQAMRPSETLSQALASLSGADKTSDDVVVRFSKNRGNL